MQALITSIWTYRQFILSSIKNELISPFARSKLGGLWMLLNPLAQVAIYAIIFTNVLSARFSGIEHKYAYTIYLLAGTLGWNLFQEIVNRCLNVFIANANLLKKINFPSITLPVIVIGSSLLNYLCLLAVILVVFFLLGHSAGVIAFWLIPLTAACVLLSVSMGLILGLLNVFIRDIGQFVPIMMQIWFWFTPIVYPVSIIPEQYHRLLYLNPLFPIIDGYHQVLVYGVAPDLAPVLIVSACAIVLLFAGLMLFRRANDELIDML